MTPDLSPLMTPRARLGLYVMNLYPLALIDYISVNGGSGMESWLGLGFVMMVVMEMAVLMWWGMKQVVTQIPSST